MKIVRYDGGKIGVVIKDFVYDVSSVVNAGNNDWPPTEMNRLIRDYGHLKQKIEMLSKSSKPIPIKDVHLETPVPWPNKLMAYPVNYYDHAKEMSSTGFANIQGYFLKASSSLSGASEPIILPNVKGREIHHECELAVVIGKEGRSISVDDAMSYIFGYSCLLDITVRGKEERVFRKSYDTFTPVGPWIITADEIQNPSQLQMKLWINGQLRQNANTRDLIVGITEMISLASSVSTLYPGDLIATGTPAGVGPIFDGDTVVIEIESVGRMEIPVKQGTVGNNYLFEKPYEFKAAK